MHDRKKVPKETLDAAQKQQLQNKIAAYQSLVAQCFELRKSQTKTKDALALLDKLQFINPEMYSCWNYRKEILKALLEGVDDQA